MAFFNVEKTNNGNNNTFFNQDPNMYGQGGINPNMQQPMMNQGWGDFSMQQPTMNQGWGDQNMNNMMPQQPMYDQQGMYNQQPMYDQQQMYNQPMMNQTFDNNMMNQTFDNNMMDQSYDMNMTGQFTQPIQTVDNYGMNQGDWQQNQTFNQTGFNDQNMAQPMMNQTFDNNMVSPSMDNQPTFDQQPMYDQQQMYNQPMMNEPTTDTFVSNVPTNESDTFVSNLDNNNENIENQLPELNNEADAFETLGETNELNETLEMPQINEPSISQEPTPTPNPDELGVESSLPREIEKENELDEKMDTPSSYSDLTANLDPLDNANNKIPVNPIFAEIEKHQDVQEIGEQKQVKANIFAALGIVFGMVVKPGTTMLNNAKRFREMKKAVSIMLWLAFIFLVLCIGIRILVGSFDRTYSTLTETYKLVFNPARIFEASNYIEYIIIAVSISIGGVLLTALIYYASSFLNSKGVHFATYLIVSNLGLIPFMGGVIILYPACMIVSTYLALGALIFTFLCSLITLLIGMNEVLTFRSINSQIFYHVINLSVITLVAIVIFVFMIRSGWVVLPNVTL